MKIKILITAFTVALVFSWLLFRSPPSGVLPPAIKQPETITLAAYRDITPGKNFFYPESTICFTWESLVGTGPDSWEPVPLLAESWKMSDDGKEWVFHLRKGVFFHDGQPFNAHTVAANFQRYRQAPGKTRFYRFRMDRYYPGFSSIRIIDDFTVALNFDRPLFTLPYYMINWGSAMFSPACFDKKSGSFIKQPSGTGPYRVTKHVEDQYSILERFGGYWHNRSGKTEEKKIRIRVIPDVNTRYSAMKSEEIVSTMDLGGMTPTLATELLKDDRFGISVAKNSIVHFIALNGERFPFNDLRMKQAVSLMIDRALISKAFYHSFFPPAVSILSHASPFHKKIANPHDPSKAKKLASQVLGGQMVAIDLVLSSRDADYPYKETAEYLQGILSELGITVRIRRVEAGAFNDVILAGDFHMYLRRQGLPHAEAMGIFNDYMRLTGKNGMNAETQNKKFHYNYYDERVQPLLDQAATTINIEERRELYNALQEIAAETIPFIPLVYETTLIVYNKKIHGYRAMTYGATLDSINQAPKH